MPSRRTTSPRTIVVFGRGTEAGSDAGTEAGNVELSGASRRRVDAALAYLSANRASYAATPATVVFSGGWGPAAAGASEPPLAQREAVLMRDYAVWTAGDSLELFVSELQTESISTLDDVIRIRRLFIETDAHFSRESPLGLVAQRGHLHRIVYLSRWILRLRRSAMVLIKAPGPDRRSAGLPEWLITLIYRVMFLGDPSEELLLKREARLVKLIRS
jgi:hypothetical protein